MQHVERFIRLSDITHVLSASHGEITDLLEDWLAQDGEPPELLDAVHEALHRLQVEVAAGLAADEAQLGLTEGAV
jgi:hypothetical protein